MLQPEFAQKTPANMGGLELVGHGVWRLQPLHTAKHKNWNSGETPSLKAALATLCCSEWRSHLDEAKST
eukprot:5431887-Amphidinium_carterae.1